MKTGQIVIYKKCISGLRVFVDTEKKSDQIVTTLLLWLSHPCPTQLKHVKLSSRRLFTGSGE